MKTTKTENYVLGMNAINHFYSMLYAAMRKCMPDAQISQSGAYIWRGYQIVGFEKLAYGLYYCQINPLDPNGLHFQEGYKNPKRHASDFEKRHGIMQGRYYYPFSVKLDLIRTRFFDFNKDEQYTLLRNFVAYALEYAKIWQVSEARDKVTSEEFKLGKLPRHIAVKVPRTFDKVGQEFLQAWEDQTNLLMKFKTILEKFPNKEWVRPNASIYNFNFRGLRLKFNSTSVTSRWSIYFQDPIRLRFQIPGGSKNSYNLIDHGYFDLSGDEQTKQLTDFAQASLGKTI